MKVIIDKTKSIEKEISEHEPEKDPSILRIGVLPLIEMLKQWGGGREVERKGELIFLFTFFGISCFPNEIKVKFNLYCSFYIFL